MPILDRVRSWASRLKRDVMTLWFARAHPDTPWYAQAWMLLVLGYALSPIDLIPDFIPVLGYLDDVLLLPVCIWLALRLLPPPVLARARAQAADWLARSAARPRSLAGALAIAGVWVLVACALGVWLLRHFGSGPAA